MGFIGCLNTSLGTRTETGDRTKDDLYQIYMYIVSCKQHSDKTQKSIIRKLVKIWDQTGILDAPCM